MAPYSSRYGPEDFLYPYRIIVNNTKFIPKRIFTEIFADISYFKKTRIKPYQKEVIQKKNRKKN